MNPLAGLSPFGPIFEKELRATSRRKRSYLLRVLYLAALLLVLLICYQGSRGYAGGGAAARAEAQARLGSMFFLAFSMFCVIAMAAIGPVLTCTAIGSERLHKTLPVLLMTPISSWQIVSGKLFSRLLVALTLIGLSLPVLALVRLLGGVELVDMLAVICLCAVTATFAAAVGLLLSTYLSRAYAVILLSYATLAFLYLFVPFILIEGFRMRRGVEVTLAQTNVFFCTGMMAEFRMRRAVGMQPPWVTCVLLHLAMTALLLLWSSLALRRASRREGSGETGARAADGQPPRAATTAKKRLPATREVSDNPVLWRELRRPLTARRWQARVASIVCITLLLVSYAALSGQNALRDRDTHTSFAVIFCAMIWILACVLSATAIAHEKESDTWTLLLATPASGATIVWGKAAGVMRRMLWPTVLVAAHFLLFSFVGVVPFSSAFYVLWIIITFNSIWLATGLCLSLWFRKVTVAVIVNLLLGVFAYLGVLAILSAVADHRTAELVGWYAPYPYLIGWLDLRSPRYHSASFWLPGYGYGVGFSYYAAVTLAVGCAHLLLSALVLYIAARMFDRIVGRSPQLDPQVIETSRLAF